MEGQAPKLAPADSDASGDHPFVDIGSHVSLLSPTTGQASVFSQLSRTLKRGPKTGGLVKYVKVCTCLCSSTVKRPKTLERAYRRFYVASQSRFIQRQLLSGDTRGFKSLCANQGSTKVLERLAELYLGSQGGILENSEVPPLIQVPNFNPSKSLVAKL